VRGRALRILGRAREVVLAGQHIERTALRIDAGDFLAQVAVDAVEIEIALEDAGPAAFVHP
jgi:hypothetical protein